VDAKPDLMTTGSKPVESKLRLKAARRLHLDDHYPDFWQRAGGGAQEMGPAVCRPDRLTGRDHIRPKAKVIPAGT
jgi:hypothetical protein